jgi:hypothetical protein
MKACGIYRDPVRSNRGHFVKVSGLRWLCIMLAPLLWYAKAEPTFSDALALVRRELWTSPTFAMSRHGGDGAEITVGPMNRLLLVACQLPSTGRAERRTNTYKRPYVIRVHNERV